MLSRGWLSFSLVASSMLVNDCKTIRGATNLRVQRSLPEMDPMSRPLWSVPAKLQNKVREIRDDFGAAATPEHHSSDGPMLHFLFLLQEGLSHSSVWRSFFAGAPPGSWKAWAHCAESCWEDGVISTFDVQVVPTVSSLYCTDLVSPFVQLLRAALNSSTISHPNEKYVLISGATLPIKPFSVVYSSLTEFPDSDINLFASSGWPTAHVGENVIRLAKHSQWVVLNRQHARIVATQWKGFDEFRVRVNASSAGEIELQRSDFSPGFGEGSCVDEEAVLAMICGPVVIKATDVSKPVQLHCPGMGPIVHPSIEPQGTVRTLVVWGGEGAQGKLAEALLSDSDSKVVVAHGSHPAEFQVMSTPLAMALRNSQYLFARKFLQQAYTEDKVQLLLSEVDPLLVKPKPASPLI